MSEQRQRNFEITWPLFGDAQGAPFPVDPHQTLVPYAPPSAELERLAAREDLPAENNEVFEREARRMRESLPPTAPSGCARRAGSPTGSSSASRAARSRRWSR